MSSEVDRSFEVQEFPSSSVLIRASKRLRRSPRSFQDLACQTEHRQSHDFTRNAFASNQSVTFEDETKNIQPNETFSTMSGMKRTIDDLLGKSFRNFVQAREQTTTTGDDDDQRAGASTQPIVSSPSTLPLPPLPPLPPAEPTSTSQLPQPAHRLPGLQQELPHLHPMHTPLRVPTLPTSPTAPEPPAVLPPATLAPLPPIQVPTGPFRSPSSVRQRVTPVQITQQRLPSEHAMEIEQAPALPPPPSQYPTPSHPSRTDERPAYAPPDTTPQYYSASTTPRGTNGQIRRPLYVQGIPAASARPVQPPAYTSPLEGQTVTLTSGPLPTSNPTQPQHGELQPALRAVPIRPQPGEGRTRPRFPGYRCEQCEMHFQDIDLFELHRLSMHSLPRFTSYACQACNQIFSSRNLLEGHTCPGRPVQPLPKTVPLPTPSKPFVCGFCNQPFGRKSVLKNHISTVHLGERRFVCEYPDCRMPFGLKSDLKRHVESVHEKKRPFKCNICMQNFGRRSDLKRHRQSLHPGASSPPPAPSRRSGAGRGGGASGGEAPTPSTTSPH